MKSFDKADWEALPLALIGATEGVFRYFIARPVAEAVQGLIDSHAMAQDNLDATSGSQALFDNEITDTINL